MFTLLFKRPHDLIVLSLTTATTSRVRDVLFISPLFCILFPSSVPHAPTILAINGRPGLENLSTLFELLFFYEVP